jgi:hypothetical protein
MALARGRFLRVKEPLRVEEIRIDDAGIKHANPHRPRQVRSALPWFFRRERTVDYFMGNSCGFGDFDQPPSPEAM